ncbi:uncharacterized protein TNCV_4489301 [Trichonephila clavipes]|nr:uncharacterized protein TNCV_4489301 [Trichonephila clavipes]
MFSSLDRVTAKIRERFQQLQNLAQRYAFLRPEVILSMDELNLDQVPQDINKEEFQLERVCLQAFVVAKDPGCKKELINSGSLGLFKYIIESKLEDGLPNIVIRETTNFRSTPGGESSRYAIESDVVNYHDFQQICKCLATYISAGVSEY